MFDDIDNVNIGEKILDHYMKYLGEYAGSDRYSLGNQIIQILGFPNVFEGCMVFATFGMSKYFEEIHRRCEVILTVDDYYDECSEILANTVCYIISNKMDFGRGVLIEGTDSIVPGFSDLCGKRALYFTEVSGLPDEFSTVDESCKIYMCFFVTEKEVEYFKEYGSEQFENYLEENKIDVSEIKRSLE